MLTLAFESSAKAASVAVMRDDELLGQYFQNSGLTHSCTLLPMAEDLLKNLGINISEIDLFAVSRGPGSFTGIRIGVSTVKGLAWATGKPVCGVSTLEAMANLAFSVANGSIICAAMDARRKQVYNALFEFKNDKLCRLCEDRAIALSELADGLKLIDKSVYVVGDGAELCCAALLESGIDARLAPEHIRLQNAWGVALSAKAGAQISGEELSPVYLRVSQAERERNERLGKV